ncbi:MAG TPA: zinc-ribbon and DUF3426 domain-containing protein [Steroidobacteraceae bacterium]|nr:zinc-ribbon and DUF3426 domain-containing protein [Steroidobacteraceae bacterium]
MFTVCPKCALTLVVTAADLRVAQGYVRCGRCLNVFNALARLSEERPAGAPGAPPAPPPAPPPDPLVADSSELAASTPQPSEQSAPSAPGPQIDDTAEDTGEIDVELDASLIMTSTRTPVPQSAAELEDAVEAEEGKEAEETGEAEQAGEAADAPDGSEVQSLAPDPAASASAGNRGSTVGPAGGVGPPSATAAGGPASPQAQPESPPPQQTAETASPAAVAGAEQTNTAQQPPENAFELQSRRPRAGLAWTLGAGALALVLALQIVNHYRDALAANPALRAPLSAIYSALGVKLAPRWNIHAYDVRQLGASVAGATAGEIVVRASVKNSASRAQPLPLLRVTLQDRFGNRIAARDVPPGDYLPSPAAPGSLLAAGSRVDATMTFVDPGPQAVGFEIDACLPQGNGEVECAHGP